MDRIKSYLDTQLIKLKCVFLSVNAIIIQRTNTYEKRHQRKFVFSTYFLRLYHHIFFFRFYFRKKKQNCEDRLGEMTFPIVFLLPFVLLSSNRSNPIFNLNYFYASGLPRFSFLNKVETFLFGYGFRFKND